MILHLEPTISPSQLQFVNETLANLELQAHEVKTGEGHYLVAASKNYPDIRHMGALPGIRDIHRVSDQYKLVSAKWKLNHTTIDLGDGIKVGPGEFQLMSGPCSIESESQIEETLQHLKDNNIQIMRGGVYKPRSSPYSFRGLGIDGLKIWHKACREAGIKIITEVMQVSQIEAMHDYIDIFQVGARNSQNFNLLDALGEVQKPVLLKRGISGTVDELLQAGEYIFSGGNEHVIFCERGIRTYETAYRNTLDLNAVALLKEKSHLPVVVDPSHGIGVRQFVEPVALAGIMAGADGLIVETHSTPERAFSDGQQTLNFREANEFYTKARATYKFRESLA
jgi:3-deoxy-7-phosphoheptulonate synthase